MAVDADHFWHDMSSASANRKLLRTDGSWYKPAARGIAAQHDAVLDAVLAGVAELVDALDLGSSDESCGGSSPSARTKRFQRLHDE